MTSHHCSQSLELKCHTVKMRTSSEQTRKRKKRHESLKQKTSDKKFKQSNSLAQTTLFETKKKNALTILEELQCLCDVTSSVVRLVNKSSSAGVRQIEIVVHIIDTELPKLRETKQS